MLHFIFLECLMCEGMAIFLGLYLMKPVHIQLPYK
jgi:hypothetical protein